MTEGWREGYGPDEAPEGCIVERQWRTRHYSEGQWCEYGEHSIPSIMAFEKWGPMYRHRILEVVPEGGLTRAELERRLRAAEDEIDRSIWEYEWDGGKGAIRCLAISRFMSAGWKRLAKQYSAIGNFSGIRHCPFCGDEGQVVGVSYGNDGEATAFQVYCACLAAGPEGASRDEAVFLWSKRRSGVK